MRKALLAALFIFAFPAVLSAQVAFYRAEVRTTFGPTVSGAQITVCTSADTGSSTIPCPDKASIYTDSGLSSPAANPLTSDSNGNYQFYAAPGQYWATVTGNGLQPQSFPIYLSTSGGGGTPGGSNLQMQFNNNGAFGGSNITTDSATKNNLNVPGNMATTGNACQGGPRPYIDVTCPPYMARGDQGALSASISFTNGNSTITLGSQPGFQIGNGLSIPGAAAGPSLLVTQITGCDGLTYPTSAGHVCVSTSMTVSPAPGVTGANIAYDDDTIPLTNAINDSCASTVGGIGSHPPVLLPPGDYYVSQPQGSSTTPILPNCTGLNMSGPAYGSAVINAHYIGSNPGPAPVLSVSNQATLRNLTFEGYNEALIFSSVANINLSNVSAVTNYATGLSNNATVILQGVFELNWIGGYISSNQTTVPNLLIEDNNAGQPSYLLDFENQRWGPGTDIISETGVCTSLPANYLFKNIVREGADTNLLNFQQTGSYGCIYEGIILDQIQDADNTQPLLALINFNQPNGSIQGLRARYTTGSSGQAPLLTVTSAISPVSNIDVGCGYALSCSVVDSSGNLYGGSRTEEPDGGLDHSNPAASGVAPANLPICQAYGQSAHPISDRWFVNGSPCSTLGIDGYWGMLFGDGTSNGFTAQFQSTSPETLSVGMAQLLPPTSFSGSATTGGSLAAATYYGVIWATANANCTLSGATFSTWAYATGVAVSGSNDAVNFTWTDPVSTPSTPDGYCVSIATGPLSPGGGLGNSGGAIYISGAATTSFLYTGQTQTVIGNVQPYPTFTPRMNFYQNDFSPSASGGASLGLNEPWLTLYLSSGNIHYSGNIFSFPSGGSGGTICISGYATSGCSGSGTVTVVGAGSLTSTALVTGGGTTAIQTPCTACTLSSGGVMAGLTSVGTTADGTHPSSISLVGNTTLPTLTTNTVTILGPPSATPTAWSLQVPTAIPTNLHLFYCAVSSTNCLLTDTGYAYNAIPLADLATQGANTVVANVSGSTAAPTAASIPSGIQNYIAGTGYNQATPHQVTSALICADSSGSGTAQSCTTSPTQAALTTGDTFIYTTTTTNSGAGLTINIDSIGAKSVAIPGASGWTTTLTASIIPANKPLVLMYDGTNLNVQQTGTAASGGGISPVYDTATSGQTGNLSAVTMVTPGANHDYMFNWTVELSVAGTSCTGSTTVTLNAIFQSLNGSGTTTETLGTLTIANAGVGTVGFIAEGSDNILAKSGTAVQFSTSGYTLGAGCTSTNPTYIVYPTLVQLW